MPHDSWICLLNSNGPGMLSEEVRHTLKRFACELHRRRIDKMLIANDYCSGVIETEWKSELISAKGGILFKAKLDDEYGDFYRVNFLYSMDDLVKEAKHLDHLEKGAWRAIRGETLIPALRDFDPDESTNLY